MNAILNNNKVTISVPKKEANKYFVLNNMNRQKVFKKTKDGATYVLKNGDSLVTKISNKRYCKRKIKSMTEHGVIFKDTFYKHTPLVKI